MPSVSLIVCYTAFLVILGGGEMIEAATPEIYKGDKAPFSTGSGFFGFLSDLVELIVAIIQVVWNMVVILVGIISFDLARFGIADPPPLLRLAVSVPITLATIHVIWHISTGLIRGST